VYRYCEATATTFSRKCGKQDTSRCINGDKVALFISFLLILYVKNAENVDSDLSYYESCLRKRRL
jgi:hypothetical protein